MSVQLHVRAGRYYAGQAIPAKVVVIAGRDRPTLTWPRLGGVEFISGARDIRTLAASAIGNMGEETNAFGTEVTIIAQRAGSLTIPPIAAKSDDRLGRSPPVKLEVRPLPLEGRTAAFVGGVGALSVTAEVKPRSVRIGEPIEFRLILNGPGAHGTTRAPSLFGFAALPLGLTIGPGVVESAGGQTARVIRYQLRPTRAGEADLPSVSVASFDPDLARYITRKTPRVAVKVVDVPEFDPEQFGDNGAGGSSAGRQAAWVVGVTAGLLILGFAVATLVRRRGSRRRLEIGRDPQLVARRTLGQLELFGDREELAAAIVAGLAECLRRAIDRPEGALTPGDACEGVLIWTENEALAASTGRLISRCDEARFAGRGPSPGELATEARPVLEQLSSAPRRAGG